jgi:hypothetical protein
MKIIFSIIILFITAAINYSIMLAAGRHATSGVGFIIFPAGLAAIIAVWKYNPENKSDDQNLNKN